jgi:cytosine/adenosine deaminase-related metal-dependent hydrolase
MIISNVYIIGEEGLKDISIEEGMINRVAAHQTKFLSSIILPHNSIAFPGLINSHDHLDFNLFPPTGNRIYNNYTEWAKDINEHNKSSFEAVLKIPRSLRTRYGMYKNLLNGFTSVVNHGEHLDINEELLTVLQDNYSLHSTHFENNWKYKLNRLFKKKGAFVIHVGEGTDKASCREIDKLAKWNLFNRKIIAIHGVAMNAAQAAQFHAVVWCPASNFFLLNCTAPVDRLKKITNIVFGTDSTLTAPWNLWEQLRQARKTGLLSDTELLQSATTTAATVWELNSGTIAEGKIADIIVAKKKDGLNEMDNFYALNPEDILLVIHKGDIRLFDESIKDLLKDSKPDVKNFSVIFINGVVKYVQGDLPQLTNDIKQYYTDASFPFTF